MGAAAVASGGRAGRGGKRAGWNRGHDLATGYAPPELAKHFAALERLPRNDAVGAPLRAGWPAPAATLSAIASVPEPRSSGT